MCSRYEGIKSTEKFRLNLGVEPPPPGAKHDLWPGYLGSFIRRHPHADVGDDAVPEAEALNGLFGLVPHWATDTKITRSTYNARSETADSKPSFRDAYRRNQRCIIPADAIYEPDWRTGKAIPARITSSDGAPLGIAGLWSSWKDEKGALVYSYTMLTINADQHALMRQFHKPADEKRMVAILHPDQYGAWLKAEKSIVDYMNPFPAESLSVDE